MYSSHFSNPKTGGDKEQGEVSAHCGFQISVRSAGAGEGGDDVKDWSGIALLQTPI